jgi:energy-coupling factor transporter ATP-binding protein EcfA2
MGIWADYPDDYRSREIEAISTAVKAGECVSVIGLSGAGKTNLLGFMAHRISRAGGNPGMFLVDCNRLSEPSPPALYGLIRAALGDLEPAADELAALEAGITRRINRDGPLCLLIDRFDRLMVEVTGGLQSPFTSNLRALRDAHKYELTYVVAARRLLDPQSEMAELFFANTHWLGPLSESDAHWNVERYAQRRGLTWDSENAQELIHISGCYPAFLRAACEAYASGVRLDIKDLAKHPAVRRRLEEFWADQPSQEVLARSCLDDNPLLAASRPAEVIDPDLLTPKEYLLWEYLRTHPNRISEKDELIRSVWPEDQVYERGIRDDSLAQLVRRLREKVEPDPSNPRFIQTVPGRGYRFTP